MAFRTPDLSASEKPINKKEIIRSWNLYVITDEQLSKGRTHLEIARQAITGGAEVIQFRDKTATGRKLSETGLKLKQLARDQKVSFIVNDRIDLALILEADGVHVGQSDIPAAAVRRLLGPDKILGVSAASVAEAWQAEADGADYLGIGPIFEARGTKADAGNPQGLELLIQIRQKCSLPLIAIGGINLQNVASVIQAGADGAAIISAIVAADDICRAASQIKSIILSEKSRK
jgi:thiamine-phosphate pyrophosphorylase